MNLSRHFVEALHPNGRAQCLIGVGALAPHWESTAANRNANVADAIVIAPSAEECRNSFWWEAAARLTEEKLAPDGILIAVAPWPRLSGMLRHFASIGISRSVVFAQHGSGPGGIYIPLSCKPIRHAVSAFGLSRKWGWLATFLKWVPYGDRIARQLLPSVAVVLGRHGNLPFKWLRGINQGGEGAAPIIATSWRGDVGAAVIIGFSGKTSQPCCVVKRTDHAGTGPAHEAKMLRELGDAARDSGFNVPQVLDLDLPGDRWAQSFAPGMPLARSLAAGAISAESAITSVAKRLENWNRSTAICSEFTQDQRDKVLAEAGGLASHGAIDQVYLARLENAARRLSGQTVVSVAAHNDCTSANLLLAKGGGLSLVDWETACPSGLPLADFWYATADIAAARDGIYDRVSGFLECFSSAGRYAPLLCDIEARLQNALGASSDWLNLCFHLCWLHHAANERIAAGDGEPGPFLEIVTTLSNEPDLRPLRT